MAGTRIRSLKPEWLEAEDLLRLGSDARVLSVALILLADDYGRGRCVAEVLAAQVFPFERESSRVFRESLARLSRAGFAKVYEVRGQRFFELPSWSRHQKVDRPGKPRVPPPENDNSYIHFDDPREYSREPSRDCGEYSRDSRERVAPDLDRDLDLDLDLDQEGRGSARGDRERDPRETLARPSRIEPTPPPPEGASHCEPEPDPEPDLVGMVGACWERLGGGAGPDARELLAGLLPELERCAARASEPPEKLFAATAEAFAEDCRSRGKPLVLRWFCAQFAEWVIAAEGQGRPNGKPRRTPTDEEFFAAREALRAAEERGAPEEETARLRERLRLALQAVAEHGRQHAH